MGPNPHGDLALASGSGASGSDGCELPENSPHPSQRPRHGQPKTQRTSASAKTSLQGAEFPSHPSSSTLASGWQQAPPYASTSMAPGQLASMPGYPNLAAGLHYPLGFPPALSAAAAAQSQLHPQALSSPGWPAVSMVDPMASFQSLGIGTQASCAPFNGMASEQQVQALATLHAQQAIQLQRLQAQLQVAQMQILASHVHPWLLGGQGATPALVPPVLDVPYPEGGSKNTDEEGAPGPGGTEALPGCQGLHRVATKQDAASHLTHPTKCGSSSNLAAGAELFTTEQPNDMLTRTDPLQPPVLALAAGLDPTQARISPRVYNDTEGHASAAGSSSAARRMALRLGPRAYAAVRAGLLLQQATFIEQLYESHKLGHKQELLLRQLEAGSLHNRLVSGMLTEDDLISQLSNCTALDCTAAIESENALGNLKRLEADVAQLLKSCSEVLMSRTPKAGTTAAGEDPSALSASRPVAKPIATKLVTEDLRASESNRSSGRPVQPGQSSARSSSSKAREDGSPGSQERAEIRPLDLPVPGWQGGGEKPNPALPMLIAAPALPGSHLIFKPPSSSNPHNVWFEKHFKQKRMPSVSEQRSDKKRRASDADGIAISSGHASPDEVPDSPTGTRPATDKDTLSAAEEERMANRRVVRWWQDQSLTFGDIELAGCTSGLQGSGPNGTNSKRMKCPVSLLGSGDLLLSPLAGAQCQSGMLLPDAEVEGGLAPSWGDPGDRFLALCNGTSSFSGSGLGLGSASLRTWSGGALVGWGVRGGSGVNNGGGVAEGSGMRGGEVLWSGGAAAGPGLRSGGSRQKASAFKSITKSSNQHGGKELKRKVGEHEDAVSDVSGDSQEIEVASGAQAMKACRRPGGAV